MKLAYHGATHIKSDLETDIDATAKAGFNSIELWVEKIEKYLEVHSTLELRELMQSHHVKPASINSIEFIGFRGKEFYQIRDRCAKLSKIAGEIDCQLIVLVPSPIPQNIAEDKGETDFPWREVSLDFPWTGIVDEYVKVLRDLSDVSAPHDVNLTFEFIGFPWCTVRTPRGAYEIVKKVGRANVGMTIDACHFYAGGGLLEEISQLDAKKIFTFHLNDLDDVNKEAITDNNRLMPGLGVVPLDDMCRRLKEIGYNDLCAIELFRPEYWEMDPYVVAQKTYQCARKVLDPYFDIE